MKILILTNYYPPFFEGGYELACQEAADYLISQNHSVYILTGVKGIAHPAKSLPSMKPSEPVRILQYIDYLRGGVIDKYCVEKFNYRITKQAINQVKPDIVYIWGMKSVSIAPVIAVQDSRYPRLFEIGDFWPLVYRNPSLAGKLFRLVKRILPFTIGGDMIIDPAVVVSAWMKDELRDKVGSQDIHVVPNCLLIPPDRGVKLPHKPLKFLFLGRIEPMKGLDLCFAALGSILTDNPDFAFELNIYGDIELDYRQHCQKLIVENKLETQVHFHPRSNDVDDLYWEHDVMLMPTLAREAFGRVIIEAMVRRCVVIATKAYGPAEIITHGVDGFLFIRNDISDLIRKINDACNLSDGEFQSMGNLARQTVESRYELSLVKKQIIDKLEYYKDNTSLSSTVR